MNKHVWVALFSGLMSMAVGTGFAQPAFQNLDFESANVPVVPAGQLGSYVPFSDAFPGWTGYLGTQQVATALEDNLTLGAPNISILAPNWSYFPGLLPIIEGNYSALLQAGYNPGFTPIESAAIAQTGMIPATAQSIEMKILPDHNAPMVDELRVTVGGQNIVMVPLQVAATYTLYGGDISAFAGQVEELRIAALPTPQFYNTTLELDSIVFSGLAVPEPSSFGIGIAALFIAVLIARRKWLKAITTHQENCLKNP